MAARPRAITASFALLVAVPALVVQFNPHWSTVLRYERNAVLDGEVWRLLSGHFVHLGWEHLLLNLAAFSLLLGLALHTVVARGAGRTTLLAALAVTLTIALLISSALLLLKPELDWYVGLSGVLHGFTVLLVVGLWPRERWSASLLCAFLVLKVGWEQVLGATEQMSQHIGAAVVVDAHLYGLCAGLVILGLAGAIRSRPQQNCLYWSLQACQAGVKREVIQSRTDDRRNQR